MRPAHMWLKDIFGADVEESPGPHADMDEATKRSLPLPASPCVLTETPFHLQRHFQAQKYRNELSEINCKSNKRVIQKNVMRIVKEVLTRNENWRFTELLISWGIYSIMISAK